MVMAKIVRAARRFVRRSRQHAPSGLLSREQLMRVLQRERARSDRSGEVFSLVIFSVSPAASGAETLKHLARILQRRLRLTDDAGLWEADKIGVVLPATPAAGAWTVVGDVCVCVPAGLPLPLCRVYCYPSARANGSRGNGQQRGETRDARPAARAMEELFVERLPLWKRVIDVTGASIALLLLAPFLALVAAAIRLTSPGPALFRQRRGGLGGKPFTIYKFRTMVMAAEEQQAKLMALNEQEGPVFKIHDDPRVTRLGRCLRSTSIDELPQLWNVLKGDMSLVGPRPLPVREARQCQSWQSRRLDVTPGLTCLWQVKGRSAIGFIEWMRLDIRYIRARSLRQDITLLLRTVPAVLSRRGAS
jgi:lipopolysaccharide/colanic/teichoic acid biosynthesis glycosyltransferase